MSNLFREKEIQILNLIVENYLKIGRPISSGLIAQKSNFKVSSATVRNIMAKLERHGFLFQPHTSAGRVPTDKGLRFYVNNLLEELALSETSLEYPEKNFQLEKNDINSLLSGASKILSDYSDNIGFVIPPKISKVNFRHLRFIKISENKVMIILITFSNFVLTEIVETGNYFTQAELDKASQYMNESFRGKNLLYARNYLLQELPRYKVKYESLLNKLISLLKSYIYQEEHDSRIFLQGISKLIQKPEFFQMEILKSLLEKFEQKAKLTKLLSDFITLDKVKVLIGSELEIPEITDCSLVLSHYGDQSQIFGSLGIIGPKRIPYRKIISLVDLVAKRLSQTISY